MMPRQKLHEFAGRLHAERHLAAPSDCSCRVTRLFPGSRGHGADCLPLSQTTDALIRAIRGFQGAVVVVSHDQHLLTSACDELWVVGDGGAERFRGTFAQYKKEVIAGKR
jgi:hypothetical protein